MQKAVAGVGGVTLWAVVSCLAIWHSSLPAVELPRLVTPPVKTPGGVTDIVIDAAGNMYVSGIVGYKSDLVSSATYTNAGVGRVYVARYAPLAPTPSYVAVVGWPSYFKVTEGFVEEEWLAGFAVDTTGNAYVVAFEGDLTYPVTGGTYQESTGKKYVWKISATGSVSKLSTELDPAILRLERINSL